RFDLVDDRSSVKMGRDRPPCRNGFVEVPHSNRRGLCLYTPRTNAPSQCHSFPTPFPRRRSTPGQRGAPSWRGSRSQPQSNGLGVTDRTVSESENSFPTPESVARIRPAAAESAKRWNAVVEAEAS